MDEIFESTEDQGSSSHTPATDRPHSSGLTLILPALSALKQQNGAKKSKYKAAATPTDVGFGEVKKAPRPLKLKPLKEVLSKLIAQIKKKDDYAFFLSPVDASKVDGYSAVIKRPMDFGTMSAKVARGRYRSLEEFTSDIRLVTGNAKLFNVPGTIYHSEADRIEAWALDHIAKAAPTVIEYETDWNIEIEQDFDDHPDGEIGPIDEGDQRHQFGTPVDPDGRSQSIPSAQGKPATGLGRRSTRGPYQKKPTNPNAISESIDPEGRLPGSRDGLGAFPAGSDMAALMLALKIKGKRYRTKKERMRIEKEGPPYRADGSLDFTEMEDPFSVLAAFVPDPLPPLLLTPLYAPKEPTNTYLHTPVTLPFPDKRPIPQLRNASRNTTPRGKRCHWTISRNPPSRGKPKERDDEDSSSNSWQVARDMQTVDWGALAVLEGSLREEMDRRGQGVGETEEKLFEVIRNSVNPDDVENLDASQEHWSLERSKEAKAYVRDVVYGGVDGFAYVRSLAEFVGGVGHTKQSVGMTASKLGMPLAEWVERNVVDLVTDGRHSLLRQTSHLLSPHRPTHVSSLTDAPHDGAIFDQISRSLKIYPSAAKDLATLREIEKHEIDMESLIRTASELLGSDGVWAGKEWKEKRIERMKASGGTNDVDVKSEGGEKEDDGMSYEGTDMFSHVLDYSAGLITDLDQRLRSGAALPTTQKDHVGVPAGQSVPSLKRKFEEDETVVFDERNHNSVGESGDEDPALRNLRLNLLALAKRAPLDSIACLPVDLVPEHIRHVVPTHR